MNAAPRPWTVEPSGGDPAGGGLFEFASWGEGALGFFGSCGNRSSAMVYFYDKCLIWWGKGVCERQFRRGEVSAENAALTENQSGSHVPETKNKGVRFR